MSYRWRKWRRLHTSSRWADGGWAGQQDRKWDGSECLSLPPSARLLPSPHTTACSEWDWTPGRPQRLRGEPPGWPAHSPTGEGQNTTIRCSNVPTVQLFPLKWSIHLGPRKLLEFTRFSKLPPKALGILTVAEEKRLLSGVTCGLCMGLLGFSLYEFLPGPGWACKCCSYVWVSHAPISALSNLTHSALSNPINSPIH